MNAMLQKRELNLAKRATGVLPVALLMKV